VANNVISLPVEDRGAVLRRSARETMSWRHQSATGAVLRSCVLPELSAASRVTPRSVRLRVELLDPESDSACRRYGAWAGLNSVADARRTLMVEVYATVLAVCLERKRSRRLHPEIRFSTFPTTHHVDISDDLLVLSPAGGGEPVCTATPRDPLYQSYVREFEAGWGQAHAAKLRLQAVEWSPLHDGDLIPRRNILNLFRELHLPTIDLADGDVDAIVERLTSHDTESDDPPGGVVSAGLPGGGW
jgi:hypothetical protein